MNMLSIIIFTTVALGGFAGNLCDASFTSRQRAHSRVAHARNNSHHNGSATYTLEDMYQGNDFMNQWDFFTGEDPTHGSVAFQSKKGATSAGLAYVQDDGTTVLAVDDTTYLAPGNNRKSVRISSKKTYSGGLFIADFYAMPHGCSVWPAWWTVGPGWPIGGEIDILEGVHNQAVNQYTLHTAVGCSLSTDNRKFTATIGNTVCASSGGDNAGCAFFDTDTRTYGKGFNMEGGGVFAHLWNGDGIKVWHFARSEMPEDITNKNPDPSSWGAPAAFWSSQTCNIGSHFYDHTLVLDTTICGDWAGATYQSAGCPGTCAEATADPNNYKDAKWKINYIAVYQQ